MKALAHRVVQELSYWLQKRLIGVGQRPEDPLPRMHSLNLPISCRQRSGSRAKMPSLQSEDSGFTQGRRWESGGGLQAPKVQATLVMQF